MRALGWWPPRKRATQPGTNWNRGRTERATIVCSSCFGEVARSGIGGNASGARGEEVAEATVVLESPSWLEGCYVGSLKVVSCMRALKECFVLGGFSHVGIRRLGESYVLLSCDEGEGLSKILTENKAWFDEMFLTVAPWDESFASEGEINVASVREASRFKCGAIGAFRGRGVGDEGGGGTEVHGGGDDVRGGRVSSTLGRVRKQGEGVPFQDALSGALMENDFLGAKVGSVSSPLMGDACIPNKSKATSDWGSRSIDEGSSCIGERGLRSVEEELLGSSSEKGGVGSNVEGRHSRGIAGRGSLRVLEGVNGVGAEICNVSGKDFGWDSYVEVGPQHALIKEVGGKVLEGCKDADYVEVGPQRALIKEVGGKELEGCKDADTEALAKAFSGTFGK
ncbi:hypothetical protein ACSQ67_023622 [Phaseolus vulgaris]